MRLSRIAILGIGATAVLIGGYVGYGRVFAQKTVQPVAQPAPVTKGNLSLTVPAAGTVKPPRAADLSFRSSGVVEEVYVQTGAAVKGGQPLAKLETRPLELQVTQSEISLKTAELNLETLTTGARPEDIANAQASVELARQKQVRMEAQGEPADIATAEASLQSAKARLEQLINPSPTDIAAAENTVKTAGASLLSAQARLEQLLHPSAADIASAESGLTSARTKLDQLKNPAPEDIASARAAVDSAKASLQSAEIALDDLRNPPADQVNSARVAVMNAENSLAAANNSLTQLQIGLTDENRRILVEAYRQLYIARDTLAADKARQASPETIADDEAAVLRALRVVETAEANTNYPNAGVTAQQLRTAETAVETARITLESNRLKLDKLLNPSASDINAAGAKVASAQATLASAQAKLNTLLHPTSADLAAAESAVTSAQAKLDLLRNPSPGDLAAAQASVASAQANLQNAQNNLNKLLNPSEADQAAARASALQSESQLNKTRIPYTEADLNAQRAAVDQALAQLSKTSTPSTALDIAKSQLSVDRARLDVEQARFNLEQAVLKAPFDGIVSNVAVTAGASQGVGASTVVMSVIDPTVMEVLATVDETDVAKLELGMNASVTVEAVGERPYQGKVVAIAPTAKVQSGVVSYQVTLSVARPQGLKAGMTAMANVVYQERRDVLLVSSRAIKTNRQERSVQVLVDGKPETRVIKVGLSDDSRTEVLEGLNEGDQVLVLGATVRTNTQNRLPGGGFQTFGPGGGPIMSGGGR